MTSLRLLPRSLVSANDARIGLHEPRTRPRDFAFAAFRNFGGLASAEDVVGCLLARCDQPVSRLARWIVDRDVLSFESQGRLWLPLFQFDFSIGSVLPEAQQVFCTLQAAFDADEMIQWFTDPNPWLEEDAPIHVFMHDMSAVLQAARADRFVAIG